MDKEEYRVRLESIRMLAEQRDFHAAAQIADTVDWKRVKSVRTLLMVAEIYEADTQYEKANRILQFAYWRSHTSKTVLYRLTEINIKLGSYSDALKYCDEFEILAPKDSTRLLLRYKLLTARKDSLSDRIKLLEQYRETDFTEKWAFELAQLYREDGQYDKCAQLCDDIIVWFADGKYVERAREMRKKLHVAAPDKGKAQKAAPGGIENTVELTNTPTSLPEAEIAPSFRENREQEVRTQLADSIRAVVSGIRTEEDTQEMAEGIRSDTVFSMDDPVSTRKVKALEPETIGRTTIAPPPIGETTDGVTQITIDDYMNETAQSGEAAEFDELLKETRANLASAVASGKYERIKTESPKSQDVPPGQMSFDDFLPEVEDGESAEKEMDPLEKLYGKETDESLGLTRAFNLQEEVAKELDRREKEKASELEEARRRRAVEQTLRSAGVKLPGDAAEEEEVSEEAAPQTEEDFFAGVDAELAKGFGKKAAKEKKVVEEPEAEILPEEDTAEAAAEDVTAEAEEPETEEPETEAAEESFPEETEETAANNDEFDFTEALLAQTEKELAEDEKKSVERMLAEAEYLEEEKPVTAEAAEPEEKKKKGGIVAWFRRFLLSTEEPEEEDEPETRSTADDEPVDTEFLAESEETAQEEIPAEADAENAAAEEPEEEQNLIVEEAVPEETAAESTDEEILVPDEPAAEEEAQETELRDSTDALIEEIIEGPEELKRIPVEPRAFDDTERDIFTYFTRIPGMSEQVTMALADVHNNAGDKTSRSGNIMIIGRQGAGKTRLSDALMVAICRDLGIEAARCAKIIASDFNEKNPAEVVSKLMGGFLVIEGAGELSDTAVEKLQRAMEFRTDGLVVMLEDEKADLKALLLRHPELEEKFTSTIVIPVFTNDELVTFAKTYAREKGYRMDEMGILALYTMIGDNQSATEPVTVGKVKSMMDAAIEKADSGTRKIGRRLSKRAVDKDGRILLREKDFDI